MADFNFRAITPQIKKMIQAKLKQKGLVNSGTLINSIQVTANSNGISVEGVSYWEFINQKYKIMDEVISSSEFAKLILDESVRQLNEDLEKDRPRD